VRASCPPETELAPGSLLRLRPLQLLLADPHAVLQPRPVDERWSYEAVISPSMVGFNPASGRVYHASRSPVARWLAEPTACSRLYNEGDGLMKPALFLAHDYLHLWAYRKINQLLGAPALGGEPITRDNLEATVFLHLLTEAVAVVGLDYWYLSTFSVNDRLDIGTLFEALTVSYHERDRSEYRRFNPDFEVQTPAFFTQLARFYCTGELEGFDVDDVRRSPRLLKWLRHEISYGADQRRHTRSWLSYLSVDDIDADAATARAPVACDEPWKIDLIERLGEALWRLIKGEVDDVPPPLPASAWRPPPGRPLDFRFVNLGALDAERVERECAAGLYTPLNLRFLFHQYVSGFVFDELDPDLRGLIAPLRDRGDFAGLRRLLRHQPRIERPTDDEALLFFVG
jgi:hypothetical protein